MSTPDDMIRGALAKKRAATQGALDRITDHRSARTLLADAVSRLPEPTEEEANTAAAAMLAEAVADGNQKGTTQDDQ